MKLVTNFLPIVFLFLAIGMIEPVLGQSKSNWIAPPESRTNNNPNTENFKIGEVLFQQACAICHGESGKGDGLAGLALKPRPANLTDNRIQQQTDGELYWKISTGKTPMPAYENVYSEEQRWSLVNYIRSLKKGD